MAQFPYYTLNVQFFITKNDELSINTIRYIHEAKKIDMFSIFCFGTFCILPQSETAGKLFVPEATVNCQDGLQS